MKPSLTFLFSLAAIVWVLGTIGCRSSADPYAKALTGGIETKDRSFRGSAPREAPRTVYVADFALDADRVKGDEGVRGRLPGEVGRGRLDNVGRRLPHPFASGDPARQAREIIDTMAESLVRACTDRSVAAQRIDIASGHLPVAGWLLQGVFTEVDEGNRFKRAVIGFGQGATQMEVQVGVGNLGSAQPRQAFIVFGTVKDPGKLPGAAVTMNP